MGERERKSGFTSYKITVCCAHKNKLDVRKRLNDSSFRGFIECFPSMELYDQVISQLCVSLANWKKTKSFLLNSCIPHLSLYGVQPYIGIFFLISVS